MMIFIFLKNKICEKKAKEMSEGFDFSLNSLIIAPIQVINIFF